MFASASLNGKVKKVEGDACKTQHDFYIKEQQIIQNATALECIWGTHLSVLFGLTVLIFASTSNSAEGIQKT